MSTGATPSPQDLENDWRLRGQLRYLKGKTWYWKKWSQSRPGWDHDHCEFCWQKFCNDNCGEGVPEGYADRSEYTWLCKKCFADFAQMFAWQVAKVDAGVRLSMVWKRLCWKVKDFVSGGFASRRARRKMKEREKGEVA